MGITALVVIIYFKACTLKEIPPKSHAEAEIRSPLKDTLRKYITLLDTLKKQYTIETPIETTYYHEKYEAPKKVIQIVHDDTSGTWYLIDSLKKIIITKDQLENYVNSSKYNLVGGTFSKKNVSIDLLALNGDIKTLKYKVDYSRFTYHYDGEGIIATKIPHKFFSTTKLEYPTSFYTTSNISVNYDPFNRALGAQLDYSIYYGRIGLINSVGLESVNHSPAKAKYQVGLTYRIK